MTVTDDVEVDKLDHQVYLKEINNSLDDNDLTRLERLFSLENGLIDNKTRERAWPIMIKSNVVDVPDYHQLGIEHRDSEQVRKDVDRSFLYSTNSIYDVGELRRRLYRLIVKVLIAIPELNYYQGYHDIASIVVLVFSDETMSYRFLYCLSIKYLRDHMMCNINPTMKQLVMIPEIVKYADFELYNIVDNIHPIFALSSIISLFAHDITDADNVAILWDYIFLKDLPQMVIYLYVAMLVHCKDEIFIELHKLSNSSTSNKSTEFDIDDIHAVLNNFLFKHFNSLSVDYKYEVANVLMFADKLSKNYRLNKLMAFSNLSEYSSLKRPTYSLEILRLQTKETLSEQEKNIKDYTNSKKQRLFHTLIFSKSNIVKISLGVGILGIIINTSLHGGILNCFDIINEASCRIHLFWDFICGGR